VLATLIGSGTPASSVLPKPSTISLLDNVVSVQLLKNRLLGIQVLEIAKTAVVTPAARDYIRECKVEVVRNQPMHSIIEPEALAERTSKSASASGSNAIARPQRLLVAGSATWLPSMAKQLCSKQAKVCEVTPDDASALRTIANGLRAGHQAGVIIVQSPHATCWQAARDDSLRPAVVSNWSELNDVLREVPVNVLILPAKIWNVPSSCNTARRFFQHLQNRS
jgi:hypothetical protein